MNRNKVIKIRVSDDEYTAISALGQNAGGVSALVRNQVLKHLPSATAQEALRELSRIGVNLNLIARRCGTSAVFETLEITARLMAIDRQAGELVAKLLTL